MSVDLYSKIPGEWGEVTARPGWSQDPVLKDSLAHCRAVTRYHAKSFYFASHLLPAEKKAAAYSIYAFCRWIDDLIDENPSGPAPSRAQLISEVDLLIAGKRDLPFALAWNRVREIYGLPLSLFHDLIEGCCRDREPVAIEDFGALADYCYYVASVVGLMMCPVFGLREAPARRQAVDMGIAMQLTNILRDVREDALKGRVYLPQNELTAGGIDPASLAARACDPVWQAFMRPQVERAWSYYQSAEAGLAHLAGDGSRQTARLMSVVYSGILTEIARRNFDNLSARTYVSTPKKFWLARKVWWSGERSIFPGLMPPPSQP
jgi:phytoene synthase